MSENLLSDKPVKNREEDRFHRYEFSKRIANAIIERKSNNCIVIGIYGAWGEGKSSVLNFISKELSFDGSILQLELNPWRYDNEEELVKTYFLKIAKILGKEVDNKKEKFGKFLSKYGELTNFLGFDTSIIGKSLVNLDLECKKEKVGFFLKECSSKLVVFVDDIDRLEKQEIQALFRLVKLTADFSNTTYILSFDKDMVASAIGERFGNGDKQSGLNFLEKIIQVPLNLPLIQFSDLKKHCFELLNDVIANTNINLTEQEAQRFAMEFSDNVLLRLKTPRLALRYINSLSFSIPLLVGEANMVDLMLIEAVKIFYPEFYEFIKNYPDYFLSSYSNDHFSEKRDKKKEEFLEHFDRVSQKQNLIKSEKEAIKSLLYYLFPIVEEAFMNMVYSDSHYIIWFKGKRIASAEYFNRYFFIL